jgi:hypothetical protein
MSAGMGQGVHRLRLGDRDLRVARSRFDLSGPVRSAMIKQSPGDSATSNRAAFMPGTM